MKRGKALREGVTIEIAARDTVDTFPKEVFQVLNHIGYGHAFVTDQSRVGDFQTVVGTEVLDGADIPEKLSELLGREVTYKDLICTLARELWQKQQTPTVN